MSKTQQQGGEPGIPTPAKAEDYVQACNDRQEKYSVRSTPSWLGQTEHRDRASWTVNLNTRTGLSHTLLRAELTPQLPHAFHSRLAIPDRRRAVTPGPGRCTRPAPPWATRMGKGLAGPSATSTYPYQMLRYISRDPSWGVKTTLLICRVNNERARIKNCVHF